MYDRIEQVVGTRRRDLCSKFTGYYSNHAYFPPYDCHYTLLVSYTVLPSAIARILRKSIVGTRPFFPFEFHRKVVK